MKILSENQVNYFFQCVKRKFELTQKHLNIWRIIYSW